MIIGIDFDGTCVSHEYPKVGQDIGAVPVLRWLVNEGHSLILTTMRGNIYGDLLDAINWFYDNGIQLYGVNENPHQRQFTASPKAYCHLYIDDSGLGCPLKIDTQISNKPFVDWRKIKEMLSDLFAGKGYVACNTLFGVEKKENDCGKSIQGR